MMVVSEEFGYQHNEGEFMLPEEYDELVADSLFFQFRRVLPRMIGVCRGIAGLGNSHDSKHLASCPAHPVNWNHPVLYGSLER